MRSLKQVTVWHSEDESDSKWEVLPLLRREGAFRVDLQAPLPLRHAGAGGNLDNVVAPLLIAVSGEGNALAGQPTEIRAWLVHGSIAFQSEGGRAALQSRPLQSVEIWHEPPGGTAVSAATQYFLVTPTLSAAELGQRPQLIFPVEEKNPLLVRSMVLYIPQQATAGGR